MSIPDVTGTLTANIATVVPVLSGHPVVAVSNTASGGPQIYVRTDGTAATLSAASVPVSPGETVELPIEPEPGTRPQVSIIAGSARPYRVRFLNRLSQSAPASARIPSRPAADWLAANPILHEGEVGYDETNLEFRVGTGVAHWADLHPIGAPGGAGITVPQVQAVVDAAITAQLGQPGGFAQLDITGVIPVDQIPDLSSTFVITAEQVRDVVGAMVTAGANVTVAYNDAADTLTISVQALTDHLNDTVDAHDASAISFVPTGTIAATTVQAAIAEASSEALPLAGDATVTGVKTFMSTPVVPDTSWTIAKTSGLQSALDGKQPLDTDLTTIAGLTATTNNLIQSVGGVWASRTPTQVKAALAIAAGDVTGLGGLASLSSVTSLQITDGTIVNGDIDPAAAIALSKLAPITTARVLGNVSGGTTAPSELTAAQIKTFLALVAADVTGVVTTTGGGKETVQAHGSMGSTETIDLANGNIHTGTMDANCVFTFTGSTASVGCSWTFILTQDATGGRTATWPASVKWANGTAPTLSTDANAVDVLVFATVNNGTTWYGSLSGAGFA